MARPVAAPGPSPGLCLCSELVQGSACWIHLFFGCLTGALICQYFVIWVPIPRVEGQWSPPWSSYHFRSGSFLWDVGSTPTVECPADLWCSSTWSTEDSAAFSKSPDAGLDLGLLCEDDPLFLICSLLHLWAGSYVSCIASAEPPSSIRAGFC